MGAPEQQGPDEAWNPRQQSVIPNKPFVDETEKSGYKATKQCHGSKTVCERDDEKIIEQYISERHAVRLEVITFFRLSGLPAGHTASGDGRKAQVCLPGGGTSAQNA